MPLASASVGAGLLIALTDTGGEIFTNGAPVFPLVVPWPRRLRQAYSVFVLKPRDRANVESDCPLASASRNNAAAVSGVKRARFPTEAGWSVDVLLFSMRGQ